MPDRVAIVGARDASPETLEQVRAYVRALPEGTVVISGGAVGVDQAAAKEAHARGLEAIVFRAIPIQKSRSAPIEGVQIQSFTRADPGWEDECAFFGAAMRDGLLLRNSFIAVECTRMIAFVQGSKGGTWDAVKQAERFKRKVEVIRG